MLVDQVSNAKQYRWPRKVSIRSQRVKKQALEVNIIQDGEDDEVGYLLRVAMMSIARNMPDVLNPSVSTIQWLNVER